MPPVPANPRHKYCNYYLSIRVNYGLIMQLSRFLTHKQEQASRFCPCVYAAGRPVCTDCPIRAANILSTLLMALLSANAAVVVVSALVFSNPPLASVPSMSPVVFVVGISFFINPFFAVGF